MSLLWYVIAIIGSIGITYAFNVVMREGMILDDYHEFLSEHYLNHPYITKVLGLCPVCVSFWITIITSLIIVPTPNFFLIFISACIVVAIIDKIDI